MAINYCVNCGKKLEQDATHCAACGEAVPVLAETATLTSAGTSQAAEEIRTVEAGEAQGAGKTGEINGTDKTDEEDFSSFADLTGFDVLTTDPGVAPQERLAGPPDRTDVMSPVGGQRVVTEFRAPKTEKSNLALPIKIAAGIAAVALVFAGVGLLAQPNTREALQEQLNAMQNPSSDTASLKDSSAEDESASSDLTSIGTVSDAQAFVDDDTAFDYLTKVYDSLQSYNDRVYTCLQTYNSVFLASDRGQREAAAGIARSLLNEMDQELKTLDSMNIGQASPLYDDCTKVRRLLNDQYQRLAVVVESWDISLEYDSPYEHQEEILEPLRRDIGGSGQNTYLEDFDAHYWESRPTK